MSPTETGLLVFVCVFGAGLQNAVMAALARVWPEDTSAAVQLGPDTSRGAALFEAVQELSPRNEAQPLLKTQAFETAVDLAQMQWLLFEQAGTSLATPLLVIVVLWLMILFLSFGLFAPRNAIVIAALIVAALSVSAALFLVLELDQPFAGLIKVSNEPIVKALKYLGR